MEEYSDENLKHLPKSLFERHVELQRQSDKKRVEKLDSGSIQSQVAYFSETFDKKTIEINDTMDRLGACLVEKENLPDCFDRLTKDIQSLNRYLSTSSSFLRVYNIRKCKDVLDDLSTKCQLLEERLMPKKKFGFKAKKCKVIDQNNSNNIDKKIISKDEMDGEILKNVKWKEKIDLNGYGFSHRTGEFLTLSPGDIDGKDVELLHLSDCTVVLFGSPNTLHVANIDKCRIFCGPVSTSVFVQHCNSCTLVFPCQQLRVHHTNKTNFYIHVTSRAIIEDSTQIQVAPFNWSYESINDHFKKSGLDIERNNWNYVDDFNWLAQDKPSPNWKVMDESERIVDWNLDYVKE